MNRGAPDERSRRVPPDRGGGGDRHPGAGRVGRARQPGHDGVGHRRIRQRVRARTSISSSIGAVVTKSIAPFEWAGQPGAPGAPDAAGDAQRGRAAGPGHRRPGSTTSSRRCSPPGPRWCAASGVARSTTTARAADLLASAPDGVVAVEVNLSCPNLEGRAASSPTTSISPPRWWPPPAGAVARDGPS